MAAAESVMLPLGSAAYDFMLKDTVTGLDIKLSDFKSDKATVIMFICNHCPYVKNILNVLVNTANDYLRKGIHFIAISSNDIEKYPADSPEKMRELAQSAGFKFPYLYDETQEVAMAYQAACTPDFYVFDGKLRLVYRGQFDDSRPGNNIEPSGKDLKSALDCIIEGREIDPGQIPSIGCSIKWKNFSK